MKFNLQIIRHGKTEATVSKLYCGSSDLPLCDEGIAEIKEYIKRGMYKNADLYFSSGMKRAVETLKLIAGESVEWIEIKELREMDFGDFELFDYERLLKDERYVKWIESQTGDISCPNGESSNNFGKRIYEGFIKLFDIIDEKQAERALVTAHGGTISYFIKNFINKDEGFYESMPEPGKGYLLDAEYKNGELKIYNFGKTE